MIQQKKRKEKYHFNFENKNLFFNFIIKRFWFLDFLYSTFYKLSTNWKKLSKNIFYCWVAYLLLVWSYSEIRFESVRPLAASFAFFLFWTVSYRDTVDTPSTSLVLNRTLAFVNIPSFNDTMINLKTEKKRFNV